MRTIALCSLVLAGAMVVGCEKTESKTPAGTPSVPASGEKSSIPSAKDVGEAAGAVASQVSDAAVQQAKEKLGQVMEYIKENKLDLADKALTELEGMKDKFPEAIQTQIANARSALNAAKSGKGLSLPGGH